MSGIGPWVTHSHHKYSRMWSEEIVDNEYGKSGGGPAAVVLNRHWWAFGVLHESWSGIAESNDAAKAAADKALAQEIENYNEYVAWLRKSMR